MTDLIIKRKPYDWVLEALSWLGVLYALVPVCLYGRIPSDAPVPVHFNYRGIADAWSGKEYILCYAFLALFCYLYLFILEKTYKWWMYPVEAGENNESRSCRMSVELMRHIRLILICFFAYLANMPLYLSAESNFTGQIPLACLAAALLLVLLVYVVKMIVFKTRHVGHHLASFSM
ncbi:MAG: DUF1648 domain-containing protein [Prevotellaceae bacterium]|nr:DUF1648 domain-containing protein [Prevotellaceae bacterium]